jgi:hypothetical protein
MMASNRFEIVPISLTQEAFDFVDDGKFKKCRGSITHWKSTARAGVGISGLNGFKPAGMNGGNRTDK